ncbi:hypothetical protein B0T16DRAFT_449362 [Cercophora newfieldiana]|uniref:Uncharacterized protein n=1 Tax=Cercophora newfieldiana TaxID=92897 RepID=A0AA39XZY5_9PEZI|nr:hypothetical protein B0T16DRAFT_449362 [Cercophora newfieldiana]
MAHTGTYIFGAGVFKTDQSATSKPGPAETEAVVVEKFVYITWESDYFVAAVLPTLLATIFSIPWKTIHHDVTSLEPFHQMTKQSGLSVPDAVALNYGGWRSLFAPAVAATSRHSPVVLSSLLEYSSVLIIVLAPGSVKMGLVGSCPESAPLRPGATGVHNDPRSILGVAALVGSGPSEIRHVFENLDFGTHNPGIKHVEKALQDANIWLGLRSGGNEYGLSVDTPEPDDFEQQSEEQLLSHDVPQPLQLHGLLFQAAAILLLHIGVLALIIYYKTTFYDTAFERFMDSQSLGPRILFAAFGLTVGFAWASVLQTYIVLLPYYNLFSHDCPADDSITLPYTSDQYTTLFTSLRRGDLLLAAVSVMTIFSDFLPVLLANVPFDRTVTWKAHNVCSWMAVAIISLMTLVLICVLAFMVSRRPKLLVDVSLIRGCPLLAVIILVCSSPNMLDTLPLVGTSTMETKARDGWIRKEDARYRLGTKSSHAAAPGGIFTLPASRTCIRDAPGPLIRPTRAAMEFILLQLVEDAAEPGTPAIVDDASSPVKSTQRKHEMTRDGFQYEDVGLYDSDDVADEQYPMSEGSSTAINKVTHLQPAEPFASRSSHGRPRTVGSSAMITRVACRWNYPWLPEIASFAFASSLLGALVVLLATQRDKEQPDWPSLLNINTLLLITIFKTALLFPVAEGIGELKWIRFTRPHARPVNVIPTFILHTIGSKPLDNRAICHLPFLLHPQRDSPTVRGVAEVHLEEVAFHGHTTIVEALAGVEQGHVVDQEYVPPSTGSVMPLRAAMNWMASAASRWAAVGAGTPGVALPLEAGDGVPGEAEENRDVGRVNAL